MLHERLTLTGRVGPPCIPLRALLMMKLACTVCGADATFYAKHPEADLFRCGSCDHCFSDQSTMRQAEAYDADYYADTHGNWFENPHVWLFQLLRERIAQLGPAPSVLDVGCGRGDFLHWLRVKEPTWRLTGIDLSANESTDGITFLQGDILERPFTEQFDAVVNLVVIEHVTDVHEFTRILIEQCRPDGLVLIMTINDRSTLYAAGRALHKFGRSAAFHRLYSAHHLNHFNVASLRSLAELHGMDVVETVLHNAPMDAIDVPRAGKLTTSVWKAGVWGTFALGRLTGRTYLQTIVCRPNGGAARVEDQGESGRAPLA